MNAETTTFRRLHAWVAGPAALILATAISVGTASANAPNPSSSTDAVTTRNADGSVTVKIGGTWDWGEVTTEPGEKSSPEADCSQRYGVGWAVDWQDTTVTPWNDAATTKAYTISKNNVMFVAAANYDGFQVGICGQKDANGFPMGPWSATHTYANGSSVPKVLCANFYDPHGKAGAPSGGVGWPEVNNVPADKRSSDFIAAGPHHDGDNSIETNAYDPDPGQGNCATPHPAPPAAPQPAAAPAAQTPAVSAASAAAPPPATKVLGQSLPRTPTAQAVAATRITFTG